MQSMSNVIHRHTEHMHADKHIIMYTAICADISADACVQMCADMSLDMHEGVSVRVCIGMSVGMSIIMCVLRYDQVTAMCTAMHVDMCVQ